MRFEGYTGALGVRTADAEHAPLVGHGHGPEPPACVNRFLTMLRLIDSCITQLKAQGPSRTCDESKEEEKGRMRGQTWPPK